MKTAIILGGSGLIGSFLLPQLLASERYQRVIALSRKPLSLNDELAGHPKLQNDAVDFDNPTSWPTYAAADVFCCLGTTQKIAGGQEPFYKVDHDYVVNACARLQQDGAQQFFVISAMGAKVGAKSFYMRTKGEAERDLMALNLPALHVFRPSLLTGPRKSRRGEGRLNEEIGGVLMALTNPLMCGKAARSRSVPAEYVAQSMLEKAERDEAGHHIHYPSAEYPQAKRRKRA